MGVRGSAAAGKAREGVGKAREGAARARVEGEMAQEGEGMDWEEKARGEAGRGLVVMVRVVGVRGSAAAGKAGEGAAMTRVEGEMAQEGEGMDWEEKARGEAGRG